MTEKQKRAADWFLEVGDWREAMRKAGYKRGCASGGAPFQSPELERYLEGRKRQKVAGEDEVLAYLSGVMRGEDPEAGVRERMRAAELLGKKLGAFGADAPEGAVIVDDL